MVSLAELKKKASTAGGARGEQAASYYTKNKGPSGKFTASGIEQGPGVSAADLTANSSSLKEYNTVTVHRPPPPPKRNATAGSGGDSTPPLPPSSSTPRYGPSSSSTSSSSYIASSSAPPAPARKPVGLGPRRTPAPPYQHAADNDLPSSTRTNLPLPLPSRSRAGSNAAQGNCIKLFSQYGKKDKEEFFGMLDEYFESKLNVAASSPSASVSSPAHTLRNLNSSSSTSSIPRTLSTTSQQPSYPPPQTHPSSALSLLHYILYDSYSSAWFSTPSAIPTPLTTRKDIRASSSWTQTGDSKSLIGIVLFGDTSIAWYKLTWSVREEKLNQLGSSFERVKKEGKYRPIPEAWDGERLYAASEMYGPLLADFAERAVVGRKPIARGECWDVAAEGLNLIFNERKDLDPPFPSIARTHGTLMFYGRAGGKSIGVWRGGDSYVRPGDIVEWRSVKIREVDMQVGAYVTLGDPEHTAIITSASPPKSIPSDNSPYPIADLISLTVVEQSQGVIPAEKTYDMSAMSEGEIWIYRPVSLIQLVGSEITPVWPPRCETWEVGQLE